ncbi:MAG: homoserine dehydrogenase [Oscillibacter sp.]|nr:homoserine dehydrogenase [Oscillibacter sp.]
MIKIAVLGLGTVGTGVVKIIEANTDPIRHKLGDTLAVKTALVRSLHAHPYRHLMVDDFRQIESDPEIRVVVETIGGSGAAYEYTRRALMAGKHVVTANKQLVAERGCELLELAKRYHVNYLFEASVGGGIPILHPLTQCMSANRIDEVYGILNGTTNYILTKMTRDGATFSQALSEAQAKGYAESDPTADVDGIDASRKICILADLAFGRQVDPNKVPAEGIGKLDLRDVQLAEKNGYRIKLIARCLRVEGSARTAYVAPHLVPADHPIASVSDVFNAIVVRGNATGEVIFCGKGAGELPTASACVADVIEALQEERPRPEIGWSAESSGFVPPAEVKSRWYLRTAEPAETLRERFPDAQLVAAERETLVFTAPMSEPQARERAVGLSVRARMRVLG